METIYCPVCSKAVSSQADITACPECCHPFNVHEWKEERAKKVETVYGALEEKLKTRTKVQLIDAYNKQKSSGGWTFYNENDIVQRTLENRFNFLIIAYSLFLAAYFQPKIEDFEKVIILVIGFLLVGFLSIAIYRTKNRFNITLDIVHSLENDDVSPIIHDENKERHKHWFNKKFRNNSIHGKFVPLLMMASFVAGMIFHIVKYVLQILKII
jgi:hypothetical protein